MLVDLDGPGRVGHFWMTVPPMRPEHLRAVVIEVFYDGVGGAEHFGAGR